MGAYYSEEYQRKFKPYKDRIEELEKELSEAQNEIKKLERKLISIKLMFNYLG